eukprot:scaffold102815_cov34-Prasinocladus_malaysianus.AAC.1
MERRLTSIVWSPEQPLDARGHALGKETPSREDTKGKDVTLCCARFSREFSNNYCRAAGATREL